ncbi:MAG: ketoacyl-ACP synthase III, partial [Acidobacteria bacterium]|nr:ketoacyl-ACP synthase III [Acidobacteriota bacterium]
MAFLKSFGAYLPDRVVGNEEIGALAGSSAEWIVNVSGIEERRYAGEEESVAAMALRAAKDCLERAGTEAARLGMVMVASGTSERRFPGPAATVASQLGLSGTPAIDLPMASAGSLFGLALAARLADIYRNILVIGAEKMSPVVLRPPMDRSSAVLFGDGAGACLVSSEPSPGAARVVDAAIFSDGAFAEDLRLEFEQPLVMNGRSVILQASR